MIFLERIAARNPATLPKETSEKMSKNCKKFSKIPAETSGRISEGNPPGKLLEGITWIIPQRIPGVIPKEVLGRIPENNTGRDPEKNA